jgi:hypothetical protein
MELQAGYGRNRAFELASLLTATPKKHWATHPHRKVTRFLLPAPAYYAVAFMETCAALLLFMPTLRRPVLSFALCLAVAGSMATWLSDAPCGCFGGLFESDWRIRALSSSSLGILSLLLLLNQPRSRMELEEHNTIEDAHHA